MIQVAKPKFKPRSLDFKSSSFEHMEVEERIDYLSPTQKVNLMGE